MREVHVALRSGVESTRFAGRYTEDANVNMSSDKGEWIGSLAVVQGINNKLRPNVHRRKVSTGTIGEDREVQPMSLDWWVKCRINKILILHYTQEYWKVERGCGHAICENADDELMG